jgi:hypothetical protein
VWCKVIVGSAEPSTRLNVYDVMNSAKPLQTVYAENAMLSEALRNAKSVGIYCPSTLASTKGVLFVGLALLLVIRNLRLHASRIVKMIEV